MTPARRQRQREIKHQIRAGDELGFSPVDETGTPQRSHTIRYERGRYRVRAADGTELGGFATFAGASRAGLEANSTSSLPWQGKATLRP